MGNNNYIKKMCKQTLAVSAFVGVAIMGTGCTIYSSETVEWIYAPQVHTNFQNDPNAQYYTNSRYFIYDKDELLVRDTVLRYENASELPEDYAISKADAPSPTLTPDKQSQIIFKGLPEGDYRLVAYHNADNCNIVKAEIGVSTSSDLRVIAKSSSHMAEESIFTSSNIVTLQRGEKTMLETKGLPIFYKVNIVFTEVDEMSSPPNSPYIVLDNIRKHYTCDGFSDIDKVGDNIDTVRLKDQPIGKLAGTAMTNKFFDEDMVELKLYEEGPKGLIGTSIISPSDFVDLTSTDLPVLDIQLGYFSNKFYIFVEDWVLLEGQDAPVGG